MEKYSTCQCSYTNLKMPMMISRFGKLYNKEELLELYIDRQAVDPSKADTEDQKILKKKLSRIAEIKNLKEIWEVKHVHKNPLFEGEDPTVTGTAKSDSAKKGNDDESYLKSLGLQTKSNPVSIDRSLIVSAGTQEKFPFSCSMTQYVMNGTHKFVFGLKSRSIVSEKALIECNSGNFKTSSANSGKAENTGSLKNVYDPRNEEVLVCPMTGEKFGRPIVLYPKDPAEVKRALGFKPSKSSKRKHEEKKEKSETSPSKEKIEKKS